MLIPAGATTFLFTTGSRRLAALATALSLPILIELVQLAVPSLGRSCQLFDTIYNLTGVLAGFWLVAGAVVLRDNVRATRHSPRAASDPDYARS
jgi:VanZ family protein